MVPSRVFPMAEHEFYSCKFSHEEQNTKGRLMAFSTSEAKQQPRARQNQRRQPEKPYCCTFFFYMTFRRNLYDTWKIFFKPVRIISIIENVFDQKLCAAIMKTITGHREWKRT